MIEVDEQTQLHGLLHLAKPIKFSQWHTIRTSAEFGKLCHDFGKTYGDENQGENLFSSIKTDHDSNYTPDLSQEINSPSYIQDPRASKLVSSVIIILLPQALQTLPNPLQQLNNTVLYSMADPNPNTDTPQPRCGGQRPQDLPIDQQVEITPRLKCGFTNLPHARTDTTSLSREPKHQ